MTSFEGLGLEPELLSAVAAKGYTTPTPIQAAAIPAVLAGRDVMAGAQTGTGKTAGFVLPILQKLHAPQGLNARVLILVPTRELAAQVADSVKAYGAHKQLRSLLVYGGVSEKPQIAGLRHGCDILIATPGRLLDLCNQGLCRLSDIRCLVLDEADRMLDMGFIHDIKRIMKLLPAERQNLLFSATYSDDIRELASRLLRQPLEIAVAARNTTAERVTQLAFKVPKEHKRHLLLHLFENGAADEGSWQQALVFCRTKHGANKLAQQLEAGGVQAAAIHGNKSQGARVRALAEFKSGKLRALVATEVASRGLDIKELPHVVNFELPNVPEDYVHRIGRTARAGASGWAISLVAPDETSLLRDIERTMRQNVPFGVTPQFVVAPMPASGGEHAATHLERRSAPPSPRHGVHSHRRGSAPSGNRGSAGGAPGRRAPRSPAAGRRG
jgi:ATP-dependent RNA helicase RhlE